MPVYRSKYCVFVSRITSKVIIPNGQMQKKRKGCDWNVLGCKAVIFHLHAFRKTMVVRVSCDSEAHMSAHATWHS